MAFDVGINFRSSSGYVSNPVGTTHCTVGAEVYPQTRGGLTFGWVVSVGGNGRDRNSTIDARIAGIHFKTDTIGTPIKFRVDLPSSGTVDIYCALGDAGASNNFYLEVFDNTTSLGTLIADKFTSGSFYDATDTGYSAANWPASNAKVTKTFSTTTAFFQLSPGLTSATKNYAVAHLRVVQGGGGGGVVLPVFMNHYRSQGIM